MKSTGIVRKLDELGRVVLPVELRRNLEIEVKDLVEIYVDNEYVILRKFRPSCVFCGGMEDIVDVKGKNICNTCISDLKSKVQ